MKIKFKNYAVLDDNNHYIILRKNNEVRAMCFTDVLDIYPELSNELFKDSKIKYLNNKIDISNLQGKDVKEKLKTLRSIINNNTKDKLFEIPGSVDRYNWYKDIVLIYNK